MNTDSLRQRAARFLSVLLLPCSLAVLFVLQNLAFNVWLHVVPIPFLRMDPAAFALGILIYGPAIFLRSRRRYSYLVIVSILTSFILLAEYAYFSYAKGFLQISALKMLPEYGAAAGTALKMFTPRMVLFVANVLLVVGAGLFARARKIAHAPLSLRGKIAAGMVIVVTVFGGYGTLLAAEKYDWGDDSRLYSQLYDLDNVVGKMGIVNYFLEDAAERALHSHEVTAADKTFVAQWAGARPAPAVPAVDVGVAKGRNLIFIQVESLENAVIGAKVGDEEITPNLNALAKKGLYFSHYFAQIGEGNTADAEFSTLNSLYPLPDSVAFIDHAQNTYAALPKLLVSNGYDTHVFHGDVPTFWNRSNIYPNLGYQGWTMKADYVSTRPIGITGLGDEDFFLQSLPTLETLPQPFMATLITLSSHTPFIIPEDLRTLPIPTDTALSDTQQQYLESMHYADHALAEFMDGLSQSPIYQHSLIVIFGDHGSYTDISKALGVETDAVDNMNNNQVPLIILAPGTPLTGTVATPGSHIDLFPTVANLLGVTPPASVLGQDLLNTATPVVVHRKSGTGAIGAILSGKLIYTASLDGAFANGSCATADTRLPLPLDDCQAMYDAQSAVVKASDTIVRGDMVPALLNPNP